jgi:sulfide dehydrogenase [flavocytochrome c] flavoprotein chain
MTITRRQFAQVAGATALTWGLSSRSRALFGQGKPQAVVIGGGAGGATAARYIAKDSKGAVEVTLIEPQKQFSTCFFSNLYLGGFRPFESITFGYDALAREHGIKLVAAAAGSVDRAARQVTLGDGSKLAYDRLIVAPGIDLKWDSVPGYSEDAAKVMPHAWKAGEQTRLLKAKLNALKDGEVIVMVCPPNPYRCPPGPYERVSMMAHALKTTGRTKSKIIVLDPKDKFSKQALFQEGWEKHYPGMVEWLEPKMHGGIKSVDPADGSVKTDLDTFKGALVNVIPAQKAGDIAAKAGLTDDKGWCPIKAESMQSAMDDNVYVLGDASIAGQMPKSAFSANSQAKVVALSVRAALAGAQAFPPRYSNTCWSLIETDDGVKVGARYEPKDGKIAEVEPFVSKTGEDAATRKQTAEEGVGWYAGITKDIFG